MTETRLDTQTLIKNAQLLCPSTGSINTADLLIQGKKIVPLEHKKANAIEIDGTGKTLAPGLVDCWARLREPGEEHKATIASESKAAVNGGITRVICSPDTQPTIDEIATVELINRRALDAKGSKILPIGAMTRGLKGENLSEMATLIEAGCVAIGHADAPLHDLRVLQRAMEYSTTFGITLVIQPTESSLAADSCAHSGPLSNRMGLSTQTGAAESVSVAKHIELARVTGARLHFNRLSSAQGVELIRQAKQEGLAITADVSIQHLLLNEHHIAGYNAQCRLLPPLRSSSDQQALVNGLKEGVIDAICSDHAPHEADAKILPFPEAEPGASVFDHYLSLLITLSEDHDIELIDVWRMASENICQLHNLSPSSLSIGATADLVLFSTTPSRVAKESEMLSSGKNSPYLGHALKGHIDYVWVDGVLRVDKAV